MAIAVTIETTIARPPADVFARIARVVVPTRFIVRGSGEIAAP